MRENNQRLEDSLLRKRYKDIQRYLQVDLASLEQTFDHLQERKMVLLTRLNNLDIKIAQLDNKED